MILAARRELQRSREVTLLREDWSGGARSMSTMVERVAQALQQEMGTAPLDEPPSSFALARAAIAAMREPTEEMIVAWIRAPGAIKGGWQGMIDAALEGK